VPALLLNLGVSVVLTLILQAVGVGEGTDVTNAEVYVS
jgi:hypothetical protein